MQKVWKCFDQKKRITLAFSANSHACQGRIWGGIVRTHAFCFVYTFIGKFRNFPEFLKLIPNRSTRNVPADIVFGVLFGGKRKGITSVGT